MLGLAGGGYLLALCRRTGASLRGRARDVPVAQVIELDHSQG